MKTQLDAKALVQELRDVYNTGCTRSAEWRIEQLNGLVRFASERREEIAQALKLDLGRSEPAAKSLEVDMILYSAASCAAKVKEWMEAEKVPSPAPDLTNSVILPEPLGVVLVLGAWNFPFVISLEPLVGAIAAGNAVVVKPSEIAPASAALIAKLLPLYVDSTAIRVVEGGVSESTQLLDQQWDKIFYTGSPRVGRIVLAAAAKHLTPVTLELGGKSPVIVDSTADLDVTAKRINRWKWGTNCGQICLAPDYVIAEESIASELIQKLKDTLLQLYGEDPSTSLDISRIVNVAHFKRLTALLHDEKTAKKIVHGGELNEKALYIAPTMILDPPLDSPVMQEEIFGPLLVVLTVKSISEAIKIVRSRPKPLSLYLFTTDQKVMDQVIHNTSSGGVTVNDVLAHATHDGLPFGGVGESGMGNYHGKFSFLTFSHLKGVTYRDFTGDVNGFSLSA